PKGRVAKMILVDQMPRHIFRGRKEAFSSDHLGLRLANLLAEDIAAGAPLHVEDAFLVAWPWVHCEDLDHTYRAVWWHASLAEAARGTPYQLRAILNRYGAERHVRLIQRFGRYPLRNAFLGRESTPAELAHLEHDRELWERQQSNLSGTLRYRLLSVGFFLRSTVYMIGCGEGDAIRHFIASCLRAL